MDDPGEGISFSPPALSPRVARLGEHYRYDSGHLTTEFVLEQEESSGAGA